MGVDGLQVFIKKQFNVNKPIPENFYTDHLYIDVNNYLHKTISKKCTENVELVSFKRLKQCLNDIIYSIKIKHSIFFSVDGPGPRSKMTTQRERRLKNLNLHKLLYYINKNRDEEIEKNGGKTEGLDKLKHDYDYLEGLELNEAFSTLNFTPGTEFMVLLKSFFVYYIKNKLSFAKKIFISAADRMGEGEWKIFQHINNSNYDLNDVITIASNDSDMILFCLLSKFKNIQIYNKDSKEVIYVNELREAIYKQTGIRDKQSILDFVLLSFLMGTDHLPKVSSFKMSSAWSHYCRSKKPLYNQESKLFNYQNLSFNILTGCNISPPSQLIDFNTLLSPPLTTSTTRPKPSTVTTTAKSTVKSITTTTTTNTTTTTITTNNSIETNNIKQENEIDKIKRENDLNSQRIQIRISIKEKLGTIMLYYCLSKGLPQNGSYKVEHDNNGSFIYLQNQVLESSTTIESLAFKFLSFEHPFWKQNFSIIKEKYIYKIHNLFRNTLIKVQQILDPNSVKKVQKKQQSYQYPFKEILKLIEKEENEQLLKDQDQFESGEEILYQGDQCFNNVNQDEDSYYYSDNEDDDSLSEIEDDIESINDDDDDDDDDNEKEEKQEEDFESNDDMETDLEDRIKEKETISNINSNGIKSIEKLNYYLYGLKWHLDYFQGICDDFNFYYPLNTPVSASMFKMSSNQDYSFVAKTDRPPFPLFFGFLLIDYSNKHLFPACYHPIYKLAPHFNVMDLRILNKEFSKAESLTQLEKIFHRYTDIDQLNQFQKSQLEFQPTLFFNVLPNRTLELYQEVIDSSSPQYSHHYKLVNTLSNRFFDPKLLFKSTDELNNLYLNIFDQSPQFLKLQQPKYYDNSNDNKFKNNKFNQNLNNNNSFNQNLNNNNRFNQNSNRYNNNNNNNINNNGEINKHNNQNISNNIDNSSSNNNYYKNKNNNFNQNQNIKNQVNNNFNNNNQNNNSFNNNNNSNNNYNNNKQNNNNRQFNNRNNSNNYTNNKRKEIDNDEKIKKKRKEF